MRTLPLALLILCLVTPGCRQVKLPAAEGDVLMEHRVESPSELERIRLRAADDAAGAALTLLTEAVLEGLEQNDYIFLFEGSGTNVPSPRITSEAGRPLVAIKRMQRDDPLCTTWMSIPRRADETESGYGGRLRSATRGICGGIAAMHSLLLLDLVQRDDVVDSSFFKANPLRQLQGADRNQMSERRLRELHEAAGATQCSTQGGTGFATNNRAGLSRFNRELREKMNDPDHTWDCTLFVRTMRDGKWVLAHFEHVESVTGGDDRSTITTTNGLEQGNQTDRVPVAPGANTWTSRPGQNPPFSFAGSTHPDSANYRRGIPAVGTVKYLCCRK